jgi:hypothetical protein
MYVWTSEQSFLYMFPINFALNSVSAFEVIIIILTTTVYDMNKGTRCQA